MAWPDWIPPDWIPPDWVPPDLRWPNLVGRGQCRTTAYSETRQALPDVSQHSDLQRSTPAPVGFFGRFQLRIARRQSIIPGALPYPDYALSQSAQQTIPAQTAGTAVWPATTGT